ncbi:MAG: pyrroline-5-carboxylate reductase [Clostridiaceae bacterium]|nr:pyrroline-5-carboxylate reductase [Clostridiaceae bacterium]
MRIGIIGMGQMGGAIARGLINHGGVAPDNIIANSLDTEVFLAAAADLGITPEFDSHALVAAADCVLLAVKPSQAEAVLSAPVPDGTTPLSALLAGKMLVSILFGRHAAELRALLPADCRLVCAIPNMPVSVGAGMWVCEDDPALATADREQFAAVFGKIGQIEYVPTQLMGVAGTLTSCGPAFVALFHEALGDAGVRYGLSRAQAYRLGAQLLAGYGTLTGATAAHPGVLKDRVCSPGGTTIRGVIALEENGFRAAVIDAFRAILEK